MRLIVLHTTDEIKKQLKWNVIFSHHNLLKNQFIRWPPILMLLFYEPSLNNFWNIFYFHSLNADKCSARHADWNFGRCTTHNSYWHTEMSRMKSDSETEKFNSFVLFPNIESENEHVRQMKMGYWAILRFWFYEPHSRIWLNFDFHCSWFSIWMFWQASAEYVS